MRRIGRPANARLVLVDTPILACETERSSSRHCARRKHVSQPGRDVTMESWRNRKTLILSRSDMIGLLTPAEYNACVEQAYRMHGEGRFYMDPKGHIVLDRFPGE